MSMKACLINNRWKLIVPEHRLKQWENQWEEVRLNHMYNHLGTNDVLYYVGAEEGDMPALCQTWGAKLVLFEPNLGVFTNIKAIWEANNLRSPFCYVGFASDRTTNEVLFVGFPEHISGEVITNHGFMELRDRNAPEVKLDDMIVNTGVPTALSIDVEGSEWHVLRGAEKMLRDHHPKIWLSVHPEIMFDHFGYYQADLRNWLKNLGYKETLLDYQHEVHLFYEKN